jgi:SpoIID/LytB domain protein
LKGLAEVSNGDHPEKQKTIAVLARTYARFYMDDANRKFPGMPYDGSDDPAIFQRYLGYGVETRSPNFVSAVQATEDEVVTYQGELIKTPYFNQSDGRTRSAQEVWGWTHTPYLKSVSDPWCEGLELKGHGVGLSGCGSTAQAEEGKDFVEIIKYYYTGVAVEKMSF